MPSRTTELCQSGAPQPEWAGQSLCALAPDRTTELCQIGAHNRNGPNSAESSRVSDARGLPPEDGPEWAGQCRVLWGLLLQGVWGPRHVHIASDIWGLFSCCLLDEARVEPQHSSRRTW